MTRSIPHTSLRFAPLAFTAWAAVALAGCSQSRSVAADPSLEVLAGAPAVASWSALQPEAALLRLPDGRERPVSLRERLQAQGLLQEIELPARGGAGRNLLSLAVHGEAAQPGLYPGKPSEAGIRAEIASAFPGRTLRIVPQPRRNAHGPYGLAVSAGTDGQRCVYAWQWLERDDRHVMESLGGAASWRARICRKAQSLDEIAAALDQIAIGVQPDLVAASEPIRPAAARTARKRSVAKATTQPKARPQQPVAAIARPAPANLATSTIAPGGRRYLADVPAGPRIPTGTDGTLVSLDQSLPAEAYRGPTARAGQAPRPVLREAAVQRGTVPSPD
jgi:hypothetical protein